MDLLEGGRKFLVFAHHKDMLDAICSCLTQKVRSKHFGNSNRHIQDRAHDGTLESFGSFSFSFRQKEDKNGRHTTDGIGPPLPVYSTHSLNSSIRSDERITIETSALVARPLSTALISNFPASLPHRCSTTVFLRNFDVSTKLTFLLWKKNLMKRYCFFGDVRFVP